jgi:glycine/D-amino acid oxidase-like deaminating enzyme
MATLPNSPLSLWLDTFGDYAPEPPLQGDITVDVAIIGGGVAGLAAAHELKRAEPSLRVAVLEHQTVGYGASGRNGSFGMTVVGLGFGTMAMLRGKQFVQDAHRYMMRAVDTLDELIQREGLDCDRIRPGFLRAATAAGYVKRIQHDVKLMNDLGFDDIHWIDADAVRARVNSPRYLGAMLEPRLVLINPAKLVREEKRLALKLGAQVFENTPVLEITRTPKFKLQTPKGAVTAEKIVFATNAYSHLFPELNAKQVPAFTYMVATEPLTPEQLAPIGWANRDHAPPRHVVRA